MLRLAFSVEDADGSRNVTVTPASLIAWERKTGRKVSSFVEGIGAEDMAWLVWHAEKKAGNVKAGFEDYLDQIVDLGDATPPKATSDEVLSDD